MPFLFIWTAMLTLPLIKARGIIGLVDYLGYFPPHLGFWSKHWIGVGFTVAVVFVLYRRIESVRIPHDHPVDRDARLCGAHDRGSVH